jgi:hypothetical protein
MSPPPPPGADPRVIAALTKYFQGYKPGTDFAFLADVCRPKLDQFLLLKNPTVAAVQKTARTFFKGKDGLSYLPDLGALKIETRPEQTVVRLPVEMKWSYPLPDELKTDSTPDDTKVDRDVTVDVEITLDPSYLVSRYVETRVRTPALREANEPGCQPDGTHPEQLHVVYDLGETYVSARRLRGEDVMRHVRTPDGDSWELESTGFAVAATTPDQCDQLDAEEQIAACNSATAAAWSQCLVPVGDGGR